MFSRMIRRSEVFKSFWRRKLTEDGAALFPISENVLISDITNSDLAAISSHFEFKRLEVRCDYENPKFPLKGRVFGIHSRVFFPVILKRTIKGKETVIKTPMLHETGSMFTHLRSDTLRALGINGEIPMGAEVFVHGRRTIVYESKAHYRNVDLWGMQYLKDARLQLSVAPSNFRAVLDFAPEVDEYDD